MDYRDNRQRWAESHQVVHFYAGQWCTFTPALTVFGVTGLRDGAGERLWYAVSDAFRDDPNIAGVVNSETWGELGLDDADEDDADYQKVVAIIFAPGIEVGSQDRNASPNDVAQYLESENADGDLYFVSADASMDFNDRLVAITHRELMSAVEKRVMSEVSSTLENYKTAYGADVSYPWLSPFGNPQIDELADFADIGSGATTLAMAGVNFIELGVRVGDVMSVSDGGEESIGVIDDVTTNTVSVTKLSGDIDSISVGDAFRISRFNGVIDVTEGLVPFHVVDEPYKTEYVVDWNLQDTNGVTVLMSGGGLPAYQTALENFVESTAWSGPVKIPIEEGTCVWTADSASGIHCNGYFEMVFFKGEATKTHASELEDTTLHFDEWGLVAGAIVENLSDVDDIDFPTIGLSTGIVRTVNDDTLILEAVLTGGVKNQFDPLDQYRVRVPSNRTDAEVVDIGFPVFLIDLDADFVTLGVEIGDTIYNHTDDAWSVITSVDPTVLGVSIAFDNGEEYSLRYNFVETRQYKFAFDYKGQVNEHGLGGRKSRDVCSNDGATLTEPDGVACQLVGAATSGSGGLTLTDNTIDDFASTTPEVPPRPRVTVGDMIVNVTDENSSGIVDTISGNTLTVLSLNGGATNEFGVGDTYRIHLREDLNDGDDLPLPDTSNDDIAKIEITDLDDSGTQVGSASAEVPTTGPTSGSIYVQDMYTDLDVQADANDTSYDLPLWFSENQWHRLMYVAASEWVLPNSPLEPADECDEPGNDCLIVEGLTPDDNKEVLVIAAGQELSTQDRLSGTLCGAQEPSFFCDYFEGENADFDFDESGPPPPTFEHSPIGDTFNDQVKIVEVVEP